MAKQTLWQWLDYSLQQHQSAALLMVVDSKGSSPGKTGAKLAITIDKSTFGTIGGGKTEYDLSEYAINSLNQGQQKIQLINKSHHSASPKNTSGQICGGEQSVALIILNQADRPLILQLQQAEKNSQPVILKINPQSLSLAPFIKNTEHASFNFQKPTAWSYQCVIGLQKKGIRYKLQGLTKPA